MEYKISLFDLKITFKRRYFKLKENQVKKILENLFGNLKVGNRKFLLRVFKFMFCWKFYFIYYFKSFKVTYKIQIF